MTGDDITIIKEFSHEILKQNNITLEFRSDDDDFDVRDFTTPTFYNKEGDDSILLLIRSILVSADRLASYHLDNVNCLDVIKINDTKDLWTINQPEHYDKERFNNQLSVVNSIKNNKTVILNAPAGYGKTDVGLMWGALSNKKLLWILPRNVIADAVYNSIIETLQAYGLSNVSVELILTSERKHCTHNDIKEFCSDIVITNIDNFLHPTVKNKFAYRQFSLCYRDIVFDEFHELLQESALFYGFINVMKLRHRHTNSKTLLLSATPIMIQSEWELLNGEKTLIYPSKEVHLPAIHTKKYQIKIVDDTFQNVKRIINDDNYKNCIAFFNSIKRAQITYHDTNSEILIHSYFLDKDFDEIKNKVFSIYGKNGNNQSNARVISTRILGAAADISAQHIYDSANSPEETLQRIGRCNRWGNFDDSSITFVHFNDKSENASKDINYENRLSNIWFSFLKENLQNKKEITLDELYLLYNEYNNLNKDVITRFITQKLKTSRVNMHKIYPYRNAKTVENNTDSNDNPTDVKPTPVIRETLRGNNADQVYYVCPYYNDENNFIEPLIEKFGKFNESVHKHFHEDTSTLKNTYKIMKKIHHQYDYPRKMIKCNFTMDDLAEIAWDSTSPYIVPNWKYHPRYGVIARKTIGDFETENNL